MSFPRYPSYKDSGVEWLGEVPEHWDIDRLKRSTIIAKNGIWGDEPQQDENDIPCVRVADFDRQALRVELTEPTIRNVVEKERVGRVLSRGDLLLEKSGGGEGQPVGCVVLYDDPRPAVCSNFVARVQTAPDMNSSFWRYVHAAAYAVRINTRSIKQTSGIQNLDASQYLDERAGFPPPTEQIQIAAFLDRETAKIDELVTEQRRLMELLKEKRQAVIFHAVTQGLNPDAPMKPSGIEWLGNLPAHWRVMPLGRVTVSRCDGPFGSGLKSDHYTESGVRVIRLQNIRRDSFNGSDEAFIDADYYESELSGHDVASGDVLIAGLGDDKNTVGRACVAPVGIEPAMVKADCFRYRLDTDQAFPEFVATQLSASSVADAGMMASGSTRSRIPLSVMATRKLAIPPISEQKEIAAFIQASTLKFDTLTAESQRAIDLLQERRSALISAAVTGQIDVRPH